MIRRFANRILDAQTGWAEPFGGVIQSLLKAIFGPVRPLKDFLNGTWLGHSLHATLTDLPIGAFTVAIFLDLVGQATAADLTLAVGILAMLGAALAGWADYTDTEGKARNYGTVHQLGMLLALALYLVSLWLRVTGVRVDQRTLPITLSLVGYLVLLVSAYTGGEIVYGLGNMVDRHAFRTGGTKWTPLEPTSFEPDKPTKAKAGAQTLVVVKRGELLFALHDTCAHAGCSLSEGKLVGETIECGCHGSRYELATGNVVQGPATFDQPRFEIRTAEGRVEARRATKGG